MTYFLGSFIDSIAPHFTEVVLFLHGPTKRERKELTYRLRSKNIRLVQLGMRLPVYIRLLLVPYYKFLFRTHGRDIDVMLFRVSTVLMPFAADYFDDRVLYFVSHSSKGVEKLKQPWYRLFLIRRWTEVYSKHELAIADGSRCVTNSPELKTELEKLLNREIRFIPSTTLLQKDIQKADLRPLNRTAQLLYVGRISYLKGVLDIIKGLRYLRETGYEAELSIVGEFDAERSFEEEVMSYIKQNYLGDDIRFLGFVGGGEDLWEIYKKSDVFVIASRESEGYPRVIWEAMANSVPVVATRVGSIPVLGEGAIEVVEPKNPEALGLGIAHILDDHTYRRRLIEKGFELVKNNTLEARGDELARWVLDWDG